MDASKNYMACTLYMATKLLATGNKGLHLRVNHEVTRVGIDMHATSLETSPMA